MFVLSQMLNNYICLDEIGIQAFIDQICLHHISVPLLDTTKLESHSYMILNSAGIPLCVLSTLKSSSSTVDP